MVVSILERDYTIAIFHFKEMVRGETHSTDWLGLYLISKVSSKPPHYRIPSRKLSKKDAMMSEASPRPGLY